MPKKKSSKKEPLGSNDWILDPKNYKSEWIRRQPLYLKKSDDRYPKMVKQIKEQGFCDCETWGLDSVICQFILPRLIRFREIHAGYPGGDMTEEQWIEILGKMVFAFDWSLNCEGEQYDGLSEEAKKIFWKKYEEGMQLFAKWFRHLWW